MATKGTVLVNASKEVAYDAFLAVCKDAGAKVKQTSRDSFTVDSESGMMWLQNRFSYEFQAQLSDHQEGTLLEAQDFSPLKMDKRFPGKLFEKLGERVSVGKLEYGDGESPSPSSR